MQKSNRFLILLASLLIFISCSKDDESKPLATPTLDWSATSVTVNDALEITIEINSEEALPEGTLDFKVEGETANSFPIKKGTHSYVTDFTFSDTNKHTAVIIYTFADGRSAVKKTIDIKKSTQEILQQSTKSNWEDF